MEVQYQTLIELFNGSLARTEIQDKELLVIFRTDRQERLTFGELKRRVKEFAFWLIQAQGIQPGKKIAILGKNRADWDVALWGIILTGAIPVLIDPERGVEAVKNHLLHTDCQLMVLADDYQDENSQRKLKEFAAGQGLDLIPMTTYERVSSPDKKVEELLDNRSRQIKADETAVILCTSGTTGDPREVELTHRNLITNIQGTLAVIEITPADKIGHVLPSNHSFGFTVTKIMPFLVGATNLYTNRYRQLPQFIKEEGLTIFLGTPAFFTVLAKRIEEKLAQQKQKSRWLRLADKYFPKLVGKMIIKKQGWTSLRFFISGAAPLPKWVLRVFWRRGLELREGYGTTENSPVYGLNFNPRKLGSVGKPIPTLLVKIVNEENQILPAGEIGEIVLGGPCIMKGYYKNPQATQAVVEVDKSSICWLHTGDLGYLDPAGYLFITGRKKYIIVLPGGKNVNPELVELVLSQAPYIGEILVVPGYQEGPAGVKQEAVKTIVQPDWEEIEVNLHLAKTYLLSQPETLKKIIWRSLNNCQRDSELSLFERVPSSELLELIEEFEKTPTGKIKREAYLKK